MSDVPAQTKRGGSSGLGSDVGPAQSEARFEFDTTTEELRWSAGMQHLYEYRDVSAAVSLELLEKHKHPADLGHMHQLVRRAKHHLEPFVYQHRIVTAVDTVKTILVAARPSRVETGKAALICGTAVDLSAVQRGRSFVDNQSAESLREQVDNLKEALTSRDVIGQAKGILMERFKVNGDEAFSLIVMASQRTQVKVRHVAERLAETGELRVD